MGTRMCVVCAGTGTLWGTPKLLQEGLGLTFDLDKARLTDGPPKDENYGLEVKCWQCLGSGRMPDKPKDPGESNG